MRLNWANADKYVSKVGRLAWLIDELVEKRAKKVARVSEIFLEAFGIYRASSTETSVWVLKN